MPALPQEQSQSDDGHRGQHGAAASQKGNILHEPGKARPDKAGYPGSGLQITIWQISVLRRWIDDMVAPGAVVTRGPEPVH